MIQLAAIMEGQLTATLHGEGGDTHRFNKLSSILETKVGRLLWGGVPTGLEVCDAMHHGGPYPATGHPGFTAVGIPTSLLRFAALQCYDNVRQDRLPVELQNKNPTGEMWRFIDGEWTQQDI